MPGFLSDPYYWITFVPAAIYTWIAGTNACAANGTTDCYANQPTNNMS